MRMNMNNPDEPNWKEVAGSFWYACHEGDGGHVEWLIEKYTDWFKEEEETDD